MLFRLIKPKEETATHSSKPSPSFLIKIQQGDKNQDLFVKVSKVGSKYSVCTTETKEEAAAFYLKVEKCNYFKILYKEKGNPYPYHLCAPARWYLPKASSSQLTLSLREHANVQSYMAFHASDTLSYGSKRLHQRELVDFIIDKEVDDPTGNKEDKLQDARVCVTCQCSVDSKDISELYVTVKGDSQRGDIETRPLKHAYYDAEAKPPKQHGAQANPLKQCVKASSEEKPKIFTKFVLMKQSATTESSNQPKGTVGEDQPPSEGSNQPKGTAGEDQSPSEGSNQPKGTAGEDQSPSEGSNQPKGTAGEDQSPSEGSNQPKGTAGEDQSPSEGSNQPKGTAGEDQSPSEGSNQPKGTAGEDQSPSEGSNQPKGTAGEDQSPSEGSNQPKGTAGEDQSPSEGSNQPKGTAGEDQSPSEGLNQPKGVPGDSSCSSKCSSVDKLDSHAQSSVGKGHPSTQSCLLM